MARQHTPDIMADLMQSSEPANNKEIKQEISKGDGLIKKDVAELRQENNKTGKLAKNKAIQQDGVIEIIESKEKATFNVSKSTLLKLEDSWIQLKRQLKGEQRVTKTAIVEMALEICIEELAQKKTGSAIYKRLAKL